MRPTSCGSAIRDRYLADLFAPEPARKHLFALHAFDAEIARVRERRERADAGRDPPAMVARRARRRRWRPATRWRRRSSRRCGRSRCRSPAFDMLHRGAHLRPLRRPDADAQRPRRLCRRDLLGPYPARGDRAGRRTAIRAARTPPAMPASPRRSSRVLRMLGARPAARGEVCAGRLAARRTASSRADLAARKATPGVVARCSPTSGAAARHHLDAASGAIRTSPAGRCARHSCRWRWSGRVLERMEGSRDRPFADARPRAMAPAVDHVAGSAARIGVGETLILPVAKPRRRPRGRGGANDAPCPRPAPLRGPSP